MKIIVSSPARISFLGGGTDLEPFSSRYGGEVLSLAINIYSRITIRTNDDTWESPYHKLPADPTLCYAILKKYGKSGMHSNITVESTFDEHIGAGLGSSGAFSVGLIAGLERIKGRRLERAEIAEKAYKLENKVKTTGRQDHYASALGGLNRLVFSDKPSFKFSPQVVDELYPYLALFYIGKAKNHNTQKTLQRLTPDRLQTLKDIKGYVKYGHKALTQGKIDVFAQLVDSSYGLKKQSNNDVSTFEVDSVYLLGMMNGALGGKLLGSGGGGYMLFLVEPSKRKKLVEVMKRKGVELVDFEPDYNGVSVRIV